MEKQPLYFLYGIAPLSVEAELSLPSGFFGIIDVIRSRSVNRIPFNDNLTIAFDCSNADRDGGRRCLWKRSRLKR
jgi:hypothetical protein